MNQGHHPVYTPAPSDFPPSGESWEVRVERKLDEILVWQRAADIRFNEGSHSILNHKERLDRLERIGAGAVIAFLLGVFGVIGSGVVWVIQHMKV